MCTFLEVKLVGTGLVVPGSCSSAFTLLYHVDESMEVVNI